MTGSVSDSSAFRAQIHWSGAYRLMTQVFAGIFVVIAPLAVILAVVAAVMNFADGSIGGGVLMLVMAAVLTVVLVVPAFFLWSRFLRKSKPISLMIDAGGVALLEGDKVLRRLPWENVAEARLSSQSERLVVSAMRPAKPGPQPRRNSYVWMDLPLAKMDGERSALSEALTRHSRGRYQAG